jgi:hypothetical protein
MRALCVLALILLAPGAEPTAAQPLRQPGQIRTLPTPFLFQRRERPGPTFSKIQLEKWLEAVSNHRPGAVDDSARVVAALAPDTLADVISGFEWGVVKTRDRQAKIDILERAAVLHTDIAMIAAGAGYADGVDTATQASLHLGAALELVEALERENQYGRPPFVFVWWRAVAAVLGERREAVSSIAFVQRTVSKFPADPDILLLAGTLHELLASPLIQDDPEAGAELQALRGNEKENLRLAEGSYREALKDHADLLEARVRLGHVLSGQRRYELAVAELAQVPDRAAEPKLLYYRDLFLGEADEGLHRHAPARDAYVRALVRCPAAQSAILALSRLEREAGDRRRSLDAVLRLLNLPPDENACRDPWRDYFVATPARLATEWLDQLRGNIRRHP